MIGIYYLLAHEAGEIQPGDDMRALNSAGGPSRN
jgi:hypothetical protein